MKTPKLLCFFLFAVLLSAYNKEKAAGGDQGAAGEGCGLAYKCIQVILMYNIPGEFMP